MCTGGPTHPQNFCPTCFFFKYLLALPPPIFELSYAPACYLNIKKFQHDQLLRLNCHLETGCMTTSPAFLVAAAFYVAKNAPQGNQKFLLERSGGEREALNELNQLVDDQKKKKWWLGKYSSSLWFWLYVSSSPAGKYGQIQ